MRSFEVDLRQESRSCVVRLSGDIDMAVVPDLRAYFEEALTDGCVNLVLDLADVDYADSSALGLLVWLDHHLTPVGGRMVLAGATDDVARILELAGLSAVATSLAMSPDVDTALEGLDLTEVTTDEQWSETLVMRARVDALGAMREQVCELAKPLGFTDAALFDIRVALGEALANAVRHGSPDDGTAEVRVNVIAFPDRLVLEVVDFGTGFDGTPAPSRDVYAPGGRGVTFMRALMDRVEFEKPDTGGTLVRLVKHRPGGRG